MKDVKTECSLKKAIVVILAVYITAFIGLSITMGWVPLIGNVFGL